jgi:hypothetical protein
MENLKDQEQVIFDLNYKNALERVVDAYSKRGTPDEDPRELNLQLGILATGHVMRMAKELRLLNRNRIADLELDIQAADRVIGMLERLILLRVDPACGSRH